MELFPAEVERRRTEPVWKMETLFLFAIALLSFVRSFVGHGVASDPLRRLLQHRDTTSNSEIKAMMFILLGEEDEEEDRSSFFPL